MFNLELIFFIEKLRKKNKNLEIENVHANSGKQILLFRLNSAKIK